MSVAPRPKRAKIIAAFLALYLLWGSTYLFIKWTVAEIPPFLMGAMRHGIAGMTLFAVASRQGIPRPTLRHWGVAMLVGTLLLAIGNGIVNWAALRVPSGLAALIVSSVPIWMVVIDWLRPGGPRPMRRVVTGLAIGTVGIAGLVWSAGGIDTGMATGAAAILACVALIIGSMSWAGGSILSRQLPRHPDGVVATSMEMMSAGMVLILFSALTGDLRGFDPAAVTLRAWGSLAYLIVAGSIIAFSAYNWLLRVSTPAKVSTYAYVNPVVAVALGWAIGGERLGGSTLAAAALLLAAVLTITIPVRQTLRQVFGPR